MTELNVGSSVPAIYASMAEVAKGVANIPKTGHMNFGNTSYDYLRADDVQTKLNPLLGENQVIVRSAYEVQTLNRGRGEGSPYVYVNLSLTYVSAIDGSEFGPVVAVGEAAATDDKSINRALTQAIKNAHRSSFQFASGEGDADDVRPGANQQPEGPNRAEQRIATASQDGPAPATGATAGSSQVKELQGQIKAAADERKKNDPDFLSHTVFAQKLLGADAQGWANDVAKLGRVLAAIKSGEVV